MAEEEVQELDEESKLEHKLEVHNEPIIQIFRYLLIELTAKFQLSVDVHDGHVYEERPIEVHPIPIDDMPIKLVVTLIYLL